MDVQSRRVALPLIPLPVSGETIVGVMDAKFLRVALLNI
jgi:hypothetical protein